MFRHHSEKERKAYRRQYYLKNLGYWEKWRANNREKVRAYLSKANHKRRLFGFVPLNEYFDGSEAHHLDKIYVIYVDKEVHRSIYHCLETGKGMNEINKYAMDSIKEKLMKLVTGI